VNAPGTTAVGRLFDAVAVALGLAPETVTWEGQAAVRLEAAARRWRGPLPALHLPVVEAGGLLQVDWRPLVRALVAAREPLESLAAAFHEALADAALALVTAAVARVGAAPVALSGGVFQNRHLAERVVAKITAAGHQVLEHAAVPPGDGGLALGQAVIAGRRASCV
jgi:hydrogenase maturation protein HypF